MGRALERAAKAAGKHRENDGSRGRWEVRRGCRACHVSKSSVDRRRRGKL